MAITVQEMHNNDPMNLGDLFKFIGEVKTAIINYNASHKYPKVTELANKIKVPVKNDYSGGGFLSTALGALGGPGATLAYSSAASKLEGDLGNIQSTFTNINLILDNPEFAETISV